MISLSKSKIKYIKSLQRKKFRLIEEKFIVEGEKTVLEFLKSDFLVVEIIATTEFYQKIGEEILPDSRYLASQNELAQLGYFASNNAVLAIVAIKNPITLNQNFDEVILALDRVNDPGNLGAVIRIADWFGVKNLLLSNNSVDVYNPKVISASKGSLTRVDVHYLDLADFFRNFPHPILAADLSGKALNDVDPIDQGLILIGSESHGISIDLEEFITEKITIPRIGGAESLNMAVATGIICNQLLSKY